MSLEPSPAELRVADLSPGAPEVDIYVDNALVQTLANVSFREVNGFLAFGAATHNIKVYVEGIAMNPVIDATVTLLPNTACTVAATGLVGEDDLSPIVLIDDRPGADMMGTASVRFVHASPDGPEVDIVVQSGPTLFRNVGFRSSAGYEDVASGATSIEVRVSEGGALALSLPQVQLAERTSFTILAVGLAGNGSLEPVVVKDTQ